MDYAKKSKDMVQEIISEIPFEDVKYILNLAFSKVAPEFWHVPASSTGKYHPLYACGDSGLARHTIAAVHFCKRVFVADPSISERERAIVIAAMLLHDTCKLGTKFEEKYTIFEHPLMVQTLLTPADLQQQPELIMLWQSINILIASHMGRWNTPTSKDMQYGFGRIVSNISKVRQLPSNIIALPKESAIEFLKLPVPTSKLELVVSQSDYTAADNLCMLTIFDDVSSAWANVSR